MSDPDLTYVVDDHDRLVQANDTYFAFAEQNRWPGAAASIGHSLWDFVEGRTMRRVQMSLLRRVRRTASPIELPFRCDAPSVRREMRIGIEPGSGRRIVFSARTLAADVRPRQGLLDPEAPRTASEIEMCGWCDRFLVDRRWVEVEAVARLDLTTAAAVPRLGHTICPECEQMLQGAQPGR